MPPPPLPPSLRCLLQTTPTHPNTNTNTRHPNPRDVYIQVPDFQKFPIKVAASQAEKNYLAKQEAQAKGRRPPGAGPASRRDRGTLRTWRPAVCVCVSMCDMTG